jgi:hypothetical protein
MSKLADPIEYLDQYPAAARRIRSVMGPLATGLGCGLAHRRRLQSVSSFTQIRRYGVFEE